MTGVGRLELEIELEGIILSKVRRETPVLETIVEDGATIGANATIVCGHRLGARSFVAAGSVVTRDVPPHALVAGVPARRIGWVSHTGERLDIDAFLADLVSLGYRMEPLVQEAGEASRRGGIIDVLAPTAESPLRIELFGREIESLRLFDPATQRSAQNVEVAEFGPARELLANDVSALESLDFGPCSREVREQFEEEITLLKDGLSFKNEGFYIPFLTPS